MAQAKIAAGPYRRLRQLLALLRDVPDDDGNYFFHLPTPTGGMRRTRLDEIEVAGADGAGTL